jgi:hypothetical protein
MIVNVCASAHAALRVVLLPLAASGWRFRGAFGGCGSGLLWASGIWQAQLEAGRASGARDRNRMGVVGVVFVHRPGRAVNPGAELGLQHSLASHQQLLGWQVTNLGSAPATVCQRCLLQTGSWCVVRMLRSLLKGRPRQQVDLR